MKSFLLLALFLFLGSAANAQVNFNSLTYSGNGCPQGTVSSVVTPDGTSISILFDEFRAEVPQYEDDTEVGPGNNGNGRGRGRPQPRANNTTNVSNKSCALSFSATLPPGTKADALEISLHARGATMFDSGVEGYFSSILVGYHGLARSKGSPTVIALKSFRNKLGIDEEWIATPHSVIQLSSGCSGHNGKDIRFDLKNHLNAEIPTGDTTKSGLITVDSNDITGLLKFTLKTRPCGGDRVAP